MADAIFTTGSVCFSLALLPALVRGPRPPAFTSALTAFWLWAFAATYVSLDLTFSAAATAVSAALWSAMLVKVRLK